MRLAYPADFVLSGLFCGCILLSLLHDLTKLPSTKSWWRHCSVETCSGCIRGNWVAA